MQINRHNYEELFLLYVDNELSAAGRKAVDAFVKENPDLQMELAALQLTVMQADDIVLDKKDWLYMEETISPLQEELMLYADDELNPEDKRTVETLLATDKNAQAEWNILQHAKLQPDMTVVFKDKRSLYRKEGGSVVGFKWWRAAAAAVLLGFGLWAGVSIYKNNQNTTTVPGELATDNKTKQEQVRPAVPANIVPTLPAEKTTAENIASASTPKNNSTQAIENARAAIEKNQTKDKIASKENTIVKDNGNKKRGNNLPEPYLENINRDESNQTVVATVLPENNNSTVSGNNKNAVIKTNPKENPTNTFIADGSHGKADPNNNAIQAVNKTDGENNNRYLNVEDDKEKRTTLAGFLRKAKRVIERTTNVKTGEGIKIAGFEIALK